VTLPPGQTRAVVEITVVGDTVAEGDEFVLVRFRAADADIRTGGLFGLGVGLIVDDDRP
jgi:hypothetical protein